MTSTRKDSNAIAGQVTEGPIVAEVTCKIKSNNLIINFFTMSMGWYSKLTTLVKLLNRFYV